MKITIETTDNKLFSLQVEEKGKIIKFDKLSKAKKALFVDCFKTFYELYSKFI